ncbi:MAG: hypothetical protein ACKN83_09615 [Vulcanococcus sp.]
MNSNGAVHGNAWWKHPVPGTSQVVTEQIESRSHNEFYDVFKDGQYVGTYQMSADAEHVTQDGYQLWSSTRHGNHVVWHQNGQWVDAIDEWNLTNVHVAKLPPEPPSAADDASDPSADQSDDPHDADDQTSDGSVQTDLDELGLGQASLQSQSVQDGVAASSAPVDVSAIAQALQAASSPDQAGPDDLGQAVSQPAEAPAPEQIADSLAQLVGDSPQTDNQLAQAVTPSQDSEQAQSGSISAPSSDEIAVATEQVIASAPSSAQSPAPNEESFKSDDQDPLRENPPEPVAADQDSAPSEDVLSEEPPQPLDHQQDDDLPPLG